MRRSPSQLCGRKRWNAGLNACLSPMLFPPPSHLSGSIVECVYPFYIWKCIWKTNDRELCQEAWKKEGRWYISHATDVPPIPPIRQWQTGEGELALSPLLPVCPGDMPFIKLMQSMDATGTSRMTNAEKCVIPKRQAVGRLHIGQTGLAYPLAWAMEQCCSSSGWSYLSPNS